MAAPVATARGTPAGLFLRDGFKSLITFATAPTISLWEKKVTPPGWDGGAAVDTTTMLNVNLYTYGPRKLKKMTEMNFVAAYDPAVFTTILSLINVQTTITVTFADGSTLAFFGYLMHFKPSALEEGKQPEAECAIMPTNTDGTFVEQTPVVVSVPGT